MVGSPNDADAHVANTHHLARAYLAGLAQFHPAVDRYNALRNQHLPCPAAVAHAGKFEQLVQLDEFAAEMKFKLLHGWVNGCGGRSIT